MQAQCILFRRYPEVLAPFKYGGYPLLLSAVTLPEDSEESNAAHFLGSEKAPLLEVWCCVLSCHTLCDEFRHHELLLPSLQHAQAAISETLPAMRPATAVSYVRC